MKTEQLSNTQVLNPDGSLSTSFRIFLESLAANQLNYKMTTIVTTTGGSATETIGAPSVIETDLTMAQVQASGVGGLSVQKSRALNGQIEVTFNADPGNSTTITVLALTPIVDNRFI
jgi:hypothetical protein